jgi:hypothetical protein
MFDTPEKAKSGGARMRQIGADHAAAIKINSASLIAGLFRPATLDEIALAESIASLLFRAARSREVGRSDLEIMRDLAPLLRDWRALPRGPAPTAEPTA